MIPVKNLVYITLLYSFMYLWLHWSLFYEISICKDKISNSGAWSYNNVKSELNDIFYGISRNLISFIFEKTILFFLRHLPLIYVLILSYYGLVSYFVRYEYFSHSAFCLNLLKVLACIHFALTLMHFVLSIRFRGLYNGGSDMMMMVIGIGQGLNFFCLFYRSSTLWGMVFISVNLIVSYVKAGFVKSKNIDWLKGKALSHFMTHSSCLTWHDITNKFVLLKNNQSVWVILTYSTLFAELSFPLCVIDIHLFWFYAVWAFVFHIFNFLIFGLNRFFWAWSCAWPALYYLINLIQHN